MLLSVQILRYQIFKLRPAVPQPSPCPDRCIKFQTHSILPQLHPNYPDIREMLVRLYQYTENTLIITEKLTFRRIRSRWDLGGTVTVS